MESGEIDLIEYIRVVWKRKIIVAVTALACMAVGGVVVGVMVKKSYHAEAIIEIGQKLASLTELPKEYFSLSQLNYLPVPDNCVSVGYVSVGDIDRLVKNIPYVYRRDESLAYHINVEEEERIGVIGKKSVSSSIRLSVVCVDMKKSEEILEEIVNSLIGDLIRVTEDSFNKRKVKQMKTMDTLKERIVFIETRFGDGKYKSISEGQTEINKAENVDIDTDTDTERLIALMNMKSIYKHLVNYQNEISTSENIEKCKTKLIGEIVVSEIVNTSKNMLIVLSSGVVGLMISSFLAILKENLRKK
jgi:capsular polysaccharide biosynthesis protein